MMVRINLSPAQFKCNLPECQCTFVRRCDYARHMNTHSSTKYRKNCVICKKEYITCDQDQLTCLNDACRTQLKSELKRCSKKAIIAVGKARNKKHKSTVPKKVIKEFDKMISELDDF